MKKFNYSTFEDAINEQFGYLDFEEAIDDILQPTIDGTISDDIYKSFFEMVEEYFNMKCLDKINDSTCREIINDACQRQIENLRGY